MLKLKSTVTLIKLGKINLNSKTVDEFFQRQLRNAARAWLRAVILKIPRYTGTARGTFRPLGRYLKVAVGPGIKYGYTTPNRTSKRIQGKVYQLGPVAGEQYSSFSFSRDANGEYVFTFDQNLPYVIWNDIYPAPAWITLPSNPPWFALEAGREAFNKYVSFEMPTRKFFQALEKDLEIKSEVVRL